MRGMVIVERRDGAFFLASYSKTVPGFWVMNGWVCRLEDGAPDETLGVAVDRGLESSKTDVEAPPRNVNSATPLLELAGVRSFAAYMQGALSVGITREGETVTIEPTRNEGPRGGFTSLPDRVQVMQQPSRGDLGKAIREAFAHSL